MQQHYYCMRSNRHLITGSVTASVFDRRCEKKSLRLYATYFMCLSFFFLVLGSQRLISSSFHIGCFGREPKSIFFFTRLLKGKAKHLYRCNSAAASLLFGNKKTWISHTTDASFPIWIIIYVKCFVENFVKIFVLETQKRTRTR